MAQNVSQRLACRLAGISRRGLVREPVPDRNAALREATGGRDDGGPLRWGATGKPDVCAGASSVSGCGLVGLAKWALSTDRIVANAQRKRAMGCLST